jgi:hypothetical protein
MSQFQRALDRANQILAELDGVFPGVNGPTPKFQWKWSGDLVSLLPKLNDSGEAEMEYRCACGTDVVVHSAECGGFTVAKIKLEKQYLAAHDGPYGSYHNMYILCRWVPPIDLDDWVNSMGTSEDYPANGRYVPVDLGGNCVALPKRTQPEQLEPVSRRVVAMLQEHTQKWRQELRDSVLASTKPVAPIYDRHNNVIAEPPKDSKYWKVRDELRDARRTYAPGSTIGYRGPIIKPTEETTNAS